MARPLSDARRAAIMAAAARVIAVQGLAAPTAAIAKAAGVSNGSLFTYFETKADLFNQLYLEIKTEMAAAALDGLQEDVPLREQMLSMWTRRLRWAASAPEKRRTLAQLDVSDELTEQSRQAGHQIMAPVARMLERSRQDGPMRDAPLGFVVGIMNAIADATIDYMIQDPAGADAQSLAAFEALWRMVA